MGKYKIIGNIKKDVICFGMLLENIVDALDFPIALPIPAVRKKSTLKDAEKHSIEKNKMIASLKCCVIIIDSIFNCDGYKL